METVRDLLLIADPDGSALRRGGRAALAALVGSALLLLPAHRLHLSITAALVGVFVAMTSGAVVSDRSGREQAITLALFLPVTVAALAAGIAVAPHMWTAAALFAVVIFVSMLARRSGKRGIALGLIGFMATFFALYFKAPLAELPKMAAAVVAGLLVSAFVRFALLPDRARTIRSFQVRAIRAHAALAVDAIAAAIPTRWTGWRRERVRRRVSRLHDAAVSFEEALDEDGALTRPAVYRLEFAIERLAAVARRVALSSAVSAAYQRELARALRDARSAVRIGDREDRGSRPEERWPALARQPSSGRQQPSSRGELPSSRGEVPSTGGELPSSRGELPSSAGEPPSSRGELPSSPGELPSGSLSPPPAGAPPSSADARSVSADDVPSPFAAVPEPGTTTDRAAGSTQLVQELTDALAQVLHGSRLPEIAAPVRGIEDETPPPVRTEAPGLDPHTRLAIQATISGMAALGLGYLLSPTRWPWAVIASFVIFLRTSTLGETVVKAVERIAGTVAGVAAGLLVAHALAGHHWVALGLIYTAIFLAYYGLMLSYSWMIFWFTVLIALLYGLMGRLSTGLLVLRLEETLVGAIVGAVVAGLVLPSGTRRKLRASAAALLCGVAEVLAAAFPRQLPLDEEALRRAARAVDAQLRDLRAAARPLTRAPFTWSSDVRRLVEHASSLAFYARHLVSERRTQLQHPAPLDLQTAASELRTRALQQAGSLGERRPRRRAPAVVSDRSALAQPNLAVRTLVARWLQRIDVLLDELRDDERRLT